MGWLQHTPLTATGGVLVKGCIDRASLLPADRPNLEIMDNRTEVRDFLMSRRAKVSPADAGLPGGSNRRVTGLRRAEVAVLAGVSVEYYSRIERGDIAGASGSVLDAIGRALRLNETEMGHLLDLARAADGVPVSRRARRRPGKPLAARPAVQWMLEAVTDGVAVIRNSRSDLIAVNALGRAFYAPMIGTADPAGRPANFARFQFLDPASRDFYPDWDLFAEMCVAVMRVEVGRDPHDRAMQDLVGELSTRSELFRRLWGAHDVRTHGTGVKRFNHPVVGPLELTYQELALTDEPGLIVLVYTAEPGSPSAEKLRLLASWTAQAAAAEMSTRPGSAG